MQASVAGRGRSEPEVGGHRRTARSCRGATPVAEQEEGSSGEATAPVTRLASNSRASSAALGSTPTPATSTSRSAFRWMRTSWAAQVSPCRVVQGSGSSNGWKPRGRHRMRSRRFGRRASRTRRARRTCRAASPCGERDPRCGHSLGYSTSGLGLTLLSRRGPGPGPGLRVRRGRLQGRHARRGGVGWRRGLGGLPRRRNEEAKPPNHR